MSISPWPRCSAPGRTDVHAMNQGNDGSMCTLHADATRTAFSSAHHLRGVSQGGLPAHVTARLVGDSLHFVIHLQRLVRRSPGL